MGKYTTIRITMVDNTSIKFTNEKYVNDLVNFMSSVLTKFKHKADIIRIEWSEYDGSFGNEVAGYWKDVSLTEVIKDT